MYILLSLSLPPSFTHSFIPPFPLYISTSFFRWLWMIFPWACLSDNPTCNYSSKILSCYSSPTSYISVSIEKQFTEKALKIALEAKLKKKMMYAKPEEMKEHLEALHLMKKMSRKESNLLNQKCSINDRTLDLPNISAIPKES